MNGELSDFDTYYCATSTAAEYSAAHLPKGRLCSKSRLPDRVEQMTQLTLIAKGPFRPAAGVSAEIAVSESTITSSDREIDKRM